MTENLSQPPAEDNKTPEASIEPTGIRGDLDEAVVRFNLTDDKTLAYGVIKRVAMNTRDNRAALRAAQFMIDHERELYIYQNPKPQKVELSGSVKLSQAELDKRIDALSRKLGIIPSS